MDQQELINDYLNGKLSKKDQTLFETLIDENPEYKLQFELHKKRQVSTTLEVKDSFNTAKITADSSQISNTFRLKSWLFPVTIAFFVVLIGYFLWITLSISPGEKIYAKNYQPLVREIPENLPPSHSSGAIAEAFNAYDKSEFERAATLFDELQLRPNSDYILLYHGICLLEMDRPEKAIPLLSLIRENSNTVSKEIASWYEALGYFKLNMLDKGKQSLRVTANSANPHQEDAKKILEQLE